MVTKSLSKKPHQVGGERGGGEVQCNNLRGKKKQNMVYSLEHQPVRGGSGKDLVTKKGGRQKKLYVGTNPSKACGFQTEGKDRQWGGGWKWKSSNEKKCENAGQGKMLFDGAGAGGKKPTGGTRSWAEIHV